MKLFYPESKELEDNFIELQSKVIAMCEKKGEEIPQCHDGKIVFLKGCNKKPS